MRAHYDPKNPETFTPAIQIAIKENVMPNYLNRKTTEVSNMLWGEYNYDEDIAAQRQEAFDDGLSKGVSQGIQQGISQGIQQKAIETAKALLREDISIDVITRTTGLSTETIEQLAKEIEDSKMLRIYNVTLEKQDLQELTLENNVVGNLLSNNVYTFVITYTYDLNDQTGPHEFVVEHDVTTESYGEEPNRYVVIKPKENE